MATCAHSATDAHASSGNPSEFSATRRGAIGALLAATAATMPIAAAGAPTWSALDWITRWQRLGCGARLDGFGMLRLTPRPGVEQDAGAMLAELSNGNRMVAVRDALIKVDLGCSAARQCELIEQIDREFVSEDDDLAGHAAWMDRWCDAYDRLEHIPASTGRGLVAKLRQGMDGNGSEKGDRIIAAALRQLERWG